MNKLLLGTMMTIALAATAATAADMPVKAPPRVATAPAYDWSGIYVGVGAGGTWSDVHRFYPQAGGGPLHSTSSINDAIYNIHGGAQWQWGRWVLGVEVGYTRGFDVLENKVPLPSPPFVNLSAHHRINSLFTVGPRLGFAWDRWMIYGTGGYAAAKLDGRFVATSTGLPIFPTFWGSSRNKGWFAGGGVEVVILQGTFVDVLLGAEYQHFDLGSKQTFCVNAACNPANVNDFQLGAKGDIVRARLTIKTHGWSFGGPVVARY